MSRILVLHGPNLNLLGRREPGIYGFVTLEEINHSLQKLAAEHHVELEILQSNHEGDLVEAIHGAMGRIDALIINVIVISPTSPRWLSGRSWGSELTAMFWACKPPSSTFPTMPLEASSMVYAKMLKVLLLVTKQPISIPGLLSQL
jgi:hypothetical protein